MKRLLLMIKFGLLSFCLMAQAETNPVETDTTDLGYKIGYQIGSWLPFLLLAGILIYLTIRAARKAKENPG